MRLRNHPMGWVLLSLLLPGISYARNSQALPCAEPVRSTLRQIFTPAAQEDRKILAVDSETIAWSNQRRKFLSLKQFKARVPENSWVKYQGVNFQVKGYDPTSGSVSLEKYVDRIETKAKLQKQFKAEELIPGKIIKLADGDFQITKYSTWHTIEEQRTVHLAKIIKRNVPVQDLNFNKDVLTLHTENKSSHHDPLAKIGKNFRLLSEETEIEKPLNFYGTVVDHAPQEDFVKKYGATPGSPIRIQFFKFTKKDKKKIAVGKRKIIAFKDYPKEVERTLFSVELLDPVHPDQAIARFERFKDLKGEQGNLFNVTKFKTNIYRFVLGRGRNAKKIKIFAPVTEDLAKRAVELNSIESILAEVPVTFAKDLDSLKFDPGGLSSLGLASSGPGNWRKKSENVISFYHDTNYKVPGATVVESILARPHEEIAQTVWHELAHLYEMRIKKRIPNFDMTIWEDAAVKDQNWVSQYSEISTGEDFAETVMHYIRTEGGKTDPTFRQKFKNRFELLDQLLARVH